MKKPDSNPFLMNRRMVLRGAGGLMLGLPLLETFMPRKASAQTAARSPFVLIVVGDNGVVQAGVTLGGAGEPEKFWPTATGALTKDKMLADKTTRSIGELADYADRLLVVRGINLPYNSTGCSHSAADAQILTAAKITTGSTNCKAMGISVDTAIAKAKNPPGRDPLVLHAGMFSPGGTGFDIPGYVSYITPQQPRVYIDSPYKAYQQIIGAVGNGTTVPLSGGAGPDVAGRAQQGHQRHPPSANPGSPRAVGSQQRATALRLDQHFTAIRDIEVKITTTTYTIPDAAVDDHEDDRSQAVRPGDARHGGEAVHGPHGLLGRGGLQPGGGAEDRRSHRRPRVHLQRPVGEVPRRIAPASCQRGRLPPLPRSHDARITTSTCWTPCRSTPPRPGRCSIKASRFTRTSARRAPTRSATSRGFRRERPTATSRKGSTWSVGTGQQPGGGQDGKGGDASVSGVNKMLNTLLTAAGVTKTGGAPTDDFGEPSLPKGIFSEMHA